jgi:PAS domain S-box-containing protein
VRASTRTACQRGDELAAAVERAGAAAADERVARELDIVEMCVSWRPSPPPLIAAKINDVRDVGTRGRCMHAILFRVFDTSGFPARWHCGRWSELLGWLHIVSDAMIFAAYMAIPVALAFFIRERRDLPKPFPIVFWLFGAFIVACGVTHLLEAVIFWHPVYRLAGVVKAVTAAVSWTTLAFLVPAVPKALALKSPEHLQREIASATAELRRERDAAAHFASIVEYSQDAVISQSLSGDIRSWNPGAARMFGYSFSEIAAERSDVLVPPEYAGEWQDALRRARLGEVIDQFETERVCNNGSRISVSITISPFYNQHAELCGLSMFVRDITPRRAAEAKLQVKATELQRSNEELEQFAYLASHDLQEPLRMVVNFMELLKRNHAPTLDELANKYIDFAVDGARRMKQLVDALLTYSRVDGRGAGFQRVALQDALSGALQSLPLAIEESGAHVVSDTLPIVSGDSSQLEQVFQNLLSNAMKFRGAQPPEVRIACAEHPSHWEVTVQDNGIGFEERNTERIFQMFQRLHERSSYAGDGIGLAIAKRIVGRHGGRIWATGSPGRGATFHFTLPKLRQQHAGSEHDQNPR